MLNLHTKEEHEPRISVHALDSRLLLDCALMSMEMRVVNTLAMSVGLEGNMREV